MIENSKYTRTCPKCNNILYYNYKYDRDKAIKINSWCYPCSRSDFSIKRSERGNWERNCPVCNKCIIYARKDHLARATKRNS